jgi:hypothetical protein
MKETLQILSVLRMAYPGYYAKLSESDAVSMAKLWSRMFADDLYQEVDAAVQILICSESEFPPNIGQVKKQIASMKTDTDSAISAWNQVKSAMKFTNCVQNFNALPELSRRVVGSPNQLKEWALMDPAQINTIVQSNFLKSYKEIEGNFRAQEALPASTQNLIELIRKGMTLADGKKDELETKAEPGAVRQLAGA